MLFIIPARTGSTSVPHKNLTLVNGRSLIHHAAVRAQRTMRPHDDVVFVTDLGNRHEEYVQEFRMVFPDRGAVLHRPPVFTREQTSVATWVCDWLLPTMYGFTREAWPEWLNLVQCTHPLVSIDTMEAAITLAEENIAACVQSVARVPHQFHLDVQRFVNEERGTVLFREPGAKLPKPKQQREQMYAFGGVVLTSTMDMWHSTPRTFFLEPGAYLEVPLHEAWDFDDKETIQVGQTIARELSRV